MSSDDLFAGIDDKTDPVVEEGKNYLEELVGEGRKFKSPEELARGKVEADAFIERLKSELAELRNELSSRVRLEEAIDKLLSNQTPAAPANGDNHAPDDGGSKTEMLTTQQIEEMLERRLSEREKEQVRARNLAEVRNKLAETFGPDYVSKLKQLAVELGTSNEELNKLAAENPKMFLRLVNVGGNSAPVQNPLPKSGISPDAARPQTGVRNKAYYDNLRKTDPRTYWTPKIQNQLYNDRLALGEKFYT